MRNNKHTSRAFVLAINVPNCSLDFPVYSLYFATSPVKACTCPNWRSRSSLICFSSSRRHLSSLANMSFAFVASSCEAWDNKKAMGPMRKTLLRYIKQQVKININISKMHKAFKFRIFSFHCSSFKYILLSNVLIFDFISKKSFKEEKNSNLSTTFWVSAGKIKN